MKHTHTHTHTPGPWRYAPGEIVYGPSGETVASCRFVTNFKDTNVANMRLVAAAPDLLAALKAMMNRYGDKSEHPFCDASISARAAIVKAEGNV